MHRALLIWLKASLIWWKIFRNEKVVASTARMCVATRKNSNESGKWIIEKSVGWMQQPPMLATLNGKWLFCLSSRVVIYCNMLEFGFVINHPCGFMPCSSTMHHIMYTFTRYMVDVQQAVTTAANNKHAHILITLRRATTTAKAKV